MRQQSTGAGPLFLQAYPDLGEDRYEFNPRREINLRKQEQRHSFFTTNYHRLSGPSLAILLLDRKWDEG